MVLVLFFCGSTWMYPRIHRVGLTFFSLCFYAYWSLKFSLLLIICAGVIKVCSDLMYAFPRQKKKYMILGVMLNLSLLIYYKYTLFILSNINFICDYFTIDQIELPSLILPIGISFFTFQSMSYVIDVYRMKTTQKINFIDVLFFISFFPQLVAGPIVRSKEFLPQLKRVSPLVRSNLYTGSLFIIFGLLQKGYIADLLGFFVVEPGFSEWTNNQISDKLLCFYLFPFQLYNDFAGYTNIAIGSALMLNYKLPINFNAPFLTSRPADFWARWHISLSNWIRDYIFYPLMLSKQKWLSMGPCLLITMSLIGLWHGAAWTFIGFGVIHGLLSWFYYWQDGRFKKLISSPTGRWLAWIFFLHMVFATLVIFRIQNFSTLWKGWSGFDAYDLWNLLKNSPFLLCLALGTHVIGNSAIERFSQKSESQGWWILPLSVGVLSILLVKSDLTVTGHQAFIYFQF
jgi:alginate O-acetyltransferase complex protein AlgI